MYFFFSILKCLFYLQTIPTGGIELHVEEILRVHKTFRTARNRDCFGVSKRNYSTVSMGASQRTEPVVTAITGSEYKRAGNSETLIKWFNNREHTCDSLRLGDASKVVSLVGWTDKKTSKFIHLHDGYGHTQVIIDNETVTDAINVSGESDILLVTGRVVGRPQSHVTHSNSTGEIELFADSIRILKPNEDYDGPIRQPVVNNVVDVTANSHTSPPIEPKINNFTCRTHSCGELREAHIGTEVVLCGWLQYHRMNVFFTLRDGYGSVQGVIPSEVRTTHAHSIFHTKIILFVLVKHAIAAGEWHQHPRHPT